MSGPIWTEPGGDFLQESLRQEARALNLTHQPPTRLDVWNSQRQQLRARLRETMGSFPEAPELKLREHRKLKMPGYEIRMITFQSRPGMHVTANLYVPDGPGPFPAVLNVHGHFAQGKIAGLVAARGHMLASDGFVVLSVDAIGAGERGTKPGVFEHHGDAGVPLLSIGESLLGMQVYDNARAIDLLQSLSFVDAERIGVTGASGGGNQTMWIAAMDDRVKAAVPVVSVGTIESYVTTGNCWCETLVDGLKITESWGVLGLIAPRPTLIITAQRERIAAFLPAQMLRAHGQLKKIYALFGEEPKLAYQIIDAEHNYVPQMRRHALGWFRHWLKGEGNALACDIPVDPSLPEDQLLCFPDKKRPLEVLSLRSYITKQSRAAKQKLASAPTQSRRVMRERLAALLRTRLDDSLEHSVKVHESFETDGVRTMRFTVCSEPGVLLPCVITMPTKGCKTLVIATHPDGIDACLKQKQTESVLTADRGLCVADLRGIGLTRWGPADDRIDLYMARASLWLGRTMMGDWVTDLRAIRRAIVEVTGIKKIELLGYGHVFELTAEQKGILSRGGYCGTGDTAMASLMAAAIDPNFQRVTAVNLLATYVPEDAPSKRRYQVYVPSMLSWGDVSTIAALAGLARVEVPSLVNSESRLLTAAGRAKWIREAQQCERRLTGK